MLGKKQRLTTTDKPNKLNKEVKEKEFGVEELNRQIKAIFNLMKKIYGDEIVDEKISQLSISKYIKSKVIEERVYALHKLVFPDYEIEPFPNTEQVPGIVEKIEDGIADLLARRSVENSIQKQIAEKLEEHQSKYIEEIKKQVLNKKKGPENGNTLKKYAKIELKEKIKLSSRVTHILRPGTIEEIVGQTAAVKALISKLASPYPQHILIYGPPGVGKTTAARLALEIAKKNKHTPFKKQASFTEVDGTTLRWDPREITNPLLGSVHDPIYQGTKRDLADVGIPEPKTGLVTDAHGGILFIDEIGELDIFLQNKLLKVLEDKRVYFDSSYYDPDDENTPKYIKKLFDEGAPADFILIGATTRDTNGINPALRSRCAEIFFQPLTIKDIQDIIINAAKKLDVILGNGVAALISRYTIEGRKAINILADSYSIALHDRADDIEVGKLKITVEDVYKVLQISRIRPYDMVQASKCSEIGKVFGLGVSGFVGQVIELEAVCFESREKGKGLIKFNETAGTMAKDSVANAASVIRKLTGLHLNDYDIHVNSIGGGNIDGPSAGVAILSVILSSLQNRPIRQDIAITGEISIQGRIRPVGGITEKIYGAGRAGIKKIIIPKDNEKDVPADFKDIEIIALDSIQEVLDIVFED